MSAPQADDKARFANFAPPTADAFPKTTQLMDHSYARALKGRDIVLAAAVGTADHGAGMPHALAGRGG